MFLSRHPHFSATLTRPSVPSTDDIAPSLTGWTVNQRVSVSETSPRPNWIIGVICLMTKWRIDSKVSFVCLWDWKWTSLSSRVRSDNMNGIQTSDLVPGREAQQLGFKEDIQLSLTDVSVSSRVCMCFEVQMKAKMNIRVSPSSSVPLTYTGWAVFTPPPVIWGGHRVLRCWGRPEGPHRGQRLRIRR